MYYVLLTAIEKQLTNGRNACKIDGKGVLLLIYKELLQDHKKKSQISQPKNGQRTRMDIIHTEKPPKS